MRTHPGQFSHQNWTAPQHYDWEKITVFAPFERLDAHYGKQYTDLCCAGLVRSQ